MTAAARFKQSDVTRALKGAAAAGLRVGRVEIDIHGKIVIMSERASPAADPNPWDAAVGKA